MDQHDLKTKTVAELRAIAKSLDLKGYSRLRKDELLYLLTGAPRPAAGTPAQASPPPAGRRVGRIGAGDLDEMRPEDSGRGGRRTRERSRSQDQAPADDALPADGVDGTRQLFSNRLRRVALSNRRKTEQRVKSSKYYLGVSEEPALEEGFQYPDSYGENIITLMIRDPYWLFSYWQFAPGLFADLSETIGEETLRASKLVLRVYDVTGTDCENPNGHHDIDVAPGARNWYINVMRVERDYCVDIGVLTPDGSFITIARSNVATLPPVSASSWIEEEFAPVEVLEKLYKAKVGGPSSGSGGWGSGGWGL